MAAAGVEFGTRVTRGRNRTDEGVLATMQLLLDAGADINARSVTERRAAMPEGTSQAASFAILQRSRPSQVPSATAVPDQTAVHGAAERGYTKFVKFLAEHGADLTATDAVGRTPLDMANGVGVRGVRQAQGEGFPETAALIEKMLAARAALAPAAK
jgi:ankyrin repeat protein